MNKYDGNAVTKKDGIDHMRYAPAMYIGSTSEKGIEHLVVEILANSVDEAYNGHGNTINVELLNDGFISIEDFGRGIPVEMNDEFGIPSLEMLLTMPNTSGKFNSSNYQTSRGVHGVGATVTNALSERLIVDSYRNGFHYHQEFARGQKLTELQKLEPVTRTGTKIAFKPDIDIFVDGIGFDYNGIKTLCKEFCYLTAGLKINLTKGGKTETFVFPNGISDMLTDLTKGEDTIHSDIISVKGDVDGVTVDVGFIYTNNVIGESIYSYANCGNTPDGGTHVQGFRAGTLKAINDAATALGLLTQKQGLFKSNEAFGGMMAIVAVKLSDPEFEGQTKSKLNNKYIMPLVSDKVYSVVKYYLIDNPKTTKAIVTRILSTREMYEKYKKARESVFKEKTGKEALLATTGKLANCSGRDYKRNELFICEGDSAAGGLKSTRNAVFQAVFPIRGKILNVEKADNDKIFKNAEIIDIINILGIGYKDNINISKLKYNKIIIATDADSDGFHISCLLLTFFFRFFPELIKEGHVYLSTPPLFAIKYGKNFKEIEYFYTEEDAMKAAKERFKDKPYHMQRYKGLGEMSNEQTEELLINPETRVLRQITLEDFNKSNIYVNRIMGGDDGSVHRRELILNKRLSI